MPAIAVADGHIDVEGARLRYREVGEGPALVLIHGLGQSSTAWQRSMERLAERHRVVALDLPGFGGSSAPPDAPFSPQYFATMLRKFVDALGIDRFDAVGHSAGALALLLAALDEPATFRKIVLVDPAGFTPAPGSLLGTAAASLARLVVLLPRTRVLTKALYATAFFDAHSADDETIDEIVRRRREPSAKSAAHRAFTTHFDFCRRLEPFYRDLAALEHDVLVVWGSDDRLFRPNDGAVARRVLPRSRVEIVERCGHCPQIEQPERFAHLVLEFVDAT